MVSIKITMRTIHWFDFRKRSIRLPVKYEINWTEITSFSIKNFTGKLTNVKKKSENLHSGKGCIYLLFHSTCNAGLIFVYLYYINWDKCNAQFHLKSVLFLSLKKNMFQFFYLYSLWWRNGFKNNIYNNYNQNKFKKYWNLTPTPFTRRK